MTDTIPVADYALLSPVPLLTVVVPMVPAPCLLPNARAGWRARAKETKELRKAAYLATVDAMNQEGFDRPLSDGTLEIDLVIRWPPSRPGCDGDAALASLKALIDGVAQGIGVDDRGFVFPPVQQTWVPADAAGVVAMIRPRAGA